MPSELEILQKIDDQDKFLASIDFLRRTGAHQIQIRYSDDEEPTIWFTVALYTFSHKFQVAAGSDPVQSTMRLCETVCDGGMCTHCGKPSGFEPESMDSMPLNMMICWYQYDLGSKKFIRGCD